MKLLKDSKKYKIEHFFEEHNHKETSFLKSYFDNKMGVAFVDNTLNPKSVQICVGDFSFYAGEPNIDLVKNIKSSSKHRGLLVIEPDDKWKAMIEEHYSLHKIYPHYRQSFINKNIIFDITKLKYYESQLKEEFYIKPIDNQLYQLALENKWSEDFCINFDTYKEFSKYGIGYVVVKKDENDKEIFVSGASSYIYYEGGIEIQIATNPEYRNQGFATSIGATLILSCIDKGINPSWDSANKISSKLATKFGYVANNFYKSFAIKLD